MHEQYICITLLVWHIAVSYLTQIYKNRYLIKRTPIIRSDRFIDIAIASSAAPPIPFRGASNITFIDMKEGRYTCAGNFYGAVKCVDANDAVGFVCWIKRTIF